MFVEPIKDKGNSKMSLPISTQVKRRFYIILVGSLNSLKVIIEKETLLYEKEYAIGALKPDEWIS